MALALSILLLQSQAKQYAPKVEETEKVAYVYNMANYDDLITLGLIILVKNTN